MAQESPIIWIVEDESIVAQLVGHILESHGYITKWYSGGAEFIEVFQKETLPSLILLDIKMAPPDGNDVLEFIKDKVHPPVIILSASPEMLREDLKSVPRIILVKPPGYIELLNAVNSLILNPPEVAKLTAGSDVTIVS